MSTDLFQLLFYPAGTASSHLRCVVPSRLLERHHGFLGRIVDPETITPDAVRAGIESRVWIINREVPCLIAEQMIRRARSSGRAVAYELDDYILAPPLAHPHHSLYEAYRPRLERILAAVDLVIVSTEELARRLAPLNPNILVYKNMLPPAVPPDAVPDGPIRIGYSGLAAHAAELPFVLRLFERLYERWGDRLAFHIFGCGEPDLPSIDCPIHPTPAMPDYAEFLARLRSTNLAIGLGFLEDNDFNRCKSAVKFLEYASAGAVGVFSDVGAYRDLGEADGACVLPPDETIWLNRLHRLLEDRPLRDEFRRRAQKRAVAAYDESLIAAYAARLAALTDAPRRDDPDFKPPDEIYIHGTGRLGRYCALLLEELGTRIAGFLDNNAPPAGGELLGHPVQRPAILRRHRCPVLIASYTWFDEIHAQLAKDYRLTFADGLL